MEDLRQPCRTNPTSCALATFYSSTTAFSSYRWRFRASGLRRRSLAPCRLSRPLAAWYRSRGLRGLTARLAAAVQATRPPSSIDHPLRDLLTQFIDHIASGYADGDKCRDVSGTTHACQRHVERPGLAPAPALASCPPLCCRLDHRVDRQDLSKLPATPSSPLPSQLPQGPAPGCSTSLRAAPTQAHSRHALSSDPSSPA